MNKTIKNLILTPFNILQKINPELNTKMLYRFKGLGKLDLENPVTFSEKLNWLKLYYRNDLMPVCADKYTARTYIEEAGFGQYLPKLYWQGTDPDKIPFDKLPEAFVIKSTSGSGNNIIVHNKKELDTEKLKNITRKWLKEKYLIAYGEWHYEKFKPSIIIEELLQDGENLVPADYKFYCFNNYPGEGSVGCIAVHLDRFEEHRKLIFDRDWNHLKNVKMSIDNNCDREIKKPEKFEEMCEIANVLAKPFPHCRVDFFMLGEKFYIGELTFFTGAGFGHITPWEYDKQLGDWIKLPIIGE